MTLWVTGGKPQPSRDLSQQAVTLIPSKKEYQPGETAEVLAQLPFFPAEGLITVRRQGIVSVQRVTIKDSTYTISVPIQDAQVPNLYVQLDIVGAAARTMADGTEIKNAPKRPAFATGQMSLSVSTAKRKLLVTATPTEGKLEPGGTTQVVVSVKDSDGRPVSGGEAAVVVVDESVLALAGWSLGDPIAAFYPMRGPNANDWHLRSYVRLSDPDKLERDKRPTSTLTANRRLGASGAAPGGPGGFGGGGRGGAAFGGMMADMAAAPAMMPMAKSALRESRSESFDFAKKKDSAFDRDGDESKTTAPDGSPIRIRENFDALAVFAASVKTDTDGTAKVEVKLPDNLTRYRVIAVAVEGDKRVGTGENNLTARLPLMARPSAPRFLNFGDKFELPVVIQNQTDATMVVNVAVRATNATLTDGKGRRVTVAANDRVEVRFPTEAAKPGTARFQVAASGGGKSDAAEVSLPVWTPATTEAFATYGVIDSGAIAQPVKAPADVQPGFGGLEVTTTSTALQELTDAYIYLAQYPYGCAEQISSRVLTSAALKDVLAAFKAPGMPAPDELNAAMARDLARLGELQNDDGSYGFWIRGERPWPYLGVHAAHAFVRARQKDFKVPDDAWNRSMSYIKDIENKFPSDYPESCKRHIRAYAIYVRHLAGDTDKAKARQLLSEDTLDRLGPEIVGWMLNVLTGDDASAAKLSEMRKWLNNKATETAGAAHFSFSYGDGAYFILASDRRADGIILDALIADQPNSDLIPKLVRGLLDGRKQGAWGNTQENCFILLALDRYFRKFEGVTPDFVARIWLGDKFAGEGTFKGRTTDRVATNVPMKYLLDQPGGASNLVLGKEGAGRLYYRIGMKYAPKSLQLAPADYGFSVGRTYEAIDKPTDVRRDPDGTWVVKAGAKVRVKVSMVATTRRYHVALVDPLPAGFEALNPELRGTDPVNSEPTGNSRYGYGWWSWWHWYEHTNLRDERAEAFTSYLWEGAYEFTYVCRATTPGTFVVPPTKAEEMYAPETFGRSASDKVRVE
ncbi:MAG: alpha-2-macroglobulin family protein [Armatimonas sp.]